MTITVEHLSKHYKVYQRGEGLRASIANLFNRKYETLKAVEDISFEIRQGEIVGFLGANGAGKTTTLKCLAGLLHPTSGKLQVTGFTPYQRVPDFLRTITLVMGNRNQLLWDLPAIDSFRINQVMYDLPDQMFKQSLDELTTVLDLAPLLNKQVRKLSLGERMRCELAASLLHRPKIIFLDEPTLGLDVTAQAAIRNFIRTYNETYNATVLLTSHYMADVTALAKRILVINQGTLIYDGDLAHLVERNAPVKLLTLTLSSPVARDLLITFGEIDSEDTEQNKVSIRVPNDELKTVASRALATLPIADLTIEEPSLDAIIREVIASA